MITINAPTESFIRTETTRLAESTAGSAVTVENANGFAVNDFIVIGQQGGENAELTQITSVDGDSLTCELAREHKRGERVQVYLFDQRKFYGLSNGRWEALDDPVDIQVDDPRGAVLFFDNDAGYTDVKVTYVNSVTGKETKLEDSKPTRLTEAVSYTTVEKIRSEAGFEDNQNISNEDIEDYRLQAKAEVDAMLSNNYTLPLAYTPRLLERTTTLLAAGFLKKREYGEEGDGQGMIDEARGVLNKIDSNKIYLVDEDGDDLTRDAGSVGAMASQNPEPVFTRNGDW